MDAAREKLPSRHKNYTRFLLLVLLGGGVFSPSAAGPCVAVGTWNFAGLAVDRAGEVLSKGGSAIDAAEVGVNALELDTSEQTFVGYGGLPNADGDVELDAAIMDGKMCRYGAVLALQGIRRAVSVARLVMDRSVHNVLAGAGAIKFALNNGMRKEETLTPQSRKEWEDWNLSQKQAKARSETSPKRSNKQETAQKLRPENQLHTGEGAVEDSTTKHTRNPRQSHKVPTEGSKYVATASGTAEPRRNVTQAPNSSLRQGAHGSHSRGWDGGGGDLESHDTIGLICLDSDGNICAATSTSGWKFKHPGRIGDAPLIGAGLYADNSVGAAVATGDGEDIMRACVASVVVERMRQGDSPEKACRYAIQRVRQITRPDEEEGKDGDKQHKKLTVGVVAMSKSGEIGASSTLGPHNIHRGRPAFPAEIWRQDRGRETIFASENRRSSGVRVWRSVLLGIFWGIMANFGSFLILRFGVWEWGRLGDAFHRGK